MTVQDAGGIAKEIVTSLALTGVQGTILACVAFALARAGRLRPSWQAAIWLVVLIKFVMPYGPALPWSLADVVAMFREPAASGGPIVLTAVVGAPARAAAVGPSIAWIALAVVWAAITLSLLGRAVFRHRCAVRAAHALPAAPAIARAVLDELAQKQRTRAPRLVVGDPASGPYVIGLLAPVIVVPPALLASPALLRAALAHELAHVRRCDGLGRGIQVIAGAVFFFWPIVRLASRELDLAREAACDARALDAARLEPSAYARLLLQMATLRTAHGHALARPRALDRRIAAVLGPSRGSRLGAFRAVVLVAWIGLALGGARSARAETAVEVCRYSDDLAEALFLAHPEADVDGDGTLSRDEACELQAETRRKVIDAGDDVSRLEDGAAADLERLLSEPLCCNCGPGDGVPALGMDASCQRSL